ncbi:ADP-ribosylglycohydrolase family protein [Sulfurimonas sp.]|jgi:ADP-ribosylglycohydrolase|uniref:ADP-ribosylglycohydrolase family protein n=1 Tax=Sulfurimonas sp. TaxID=2022749 RepID=UPI0025FA2948|nr:ADP-ribosylglycohydrolase family protein [Sulfurimonas sp.]MBT5934241.1 ADP-ribosylglycohydrolase family protein [Sulfurimonas sp.]
MNTNIKKSIQSSFVCDTYSLGAHWVYDDKELAKLDINWETLNTPQSLWHKGKELGDFTHYGDQTLFLLEFITKNGSFNKEAYYDFWKEKMSKYEGYIDGSSRESMENIGASSGDLSICGRIAPLLLCSKSEEAFLKNVADFVSITHNSELALNASDFFAKILWMSQTNDDTVTLINELKPKYPLLSKWIDDAIVKKGSNSFDTIRDFGPACGIDGGFACVIYLLLQNKDFKTLMIENAKAGGDSSARGMIVAMILGIKEGIDLPEEWIKGMKMGLHI